MKLAPDRPVPIAILSAMGVTLQNSPTFHFVPTECEDVLVDGVTILAPEHSANTDAIDPSVSRRVTIANCLIDVGDDNIAIKNLAATCYENAGVIVGLPESLVQKVLLENVGITAATTGLEIRNARGIQLKNVKISAKEGEPFIVENAEVEGLTGATGNR